MELQDGFIVGIFNYCDRWCEACALTSRCQVFATSAKCEASLDPNMRAVMDAPPLPQDIPPPPPKWIDEIIEEANKEVATMTATEIDALMPKLRPEHKIIDDRAKAYMFWVMDWLKDRNRSGRSDPGDPLDVIAWYAFLNGSKIHRALTGLADDDGDREFPPDFDGSAKVALIGIDRSLEAWRHLVATQRVTESAARPCVNELLWLRDQLEQVFPNARAFVRPGFDEPGEVAGLALVD